MGCQPKYGQLNFGVYGAHQPGSVLPMSEARWSPFFNWEARELCSRADKMRWDSRWSYGCKMTGGGEIAGLDGAAIMPMTVPDWFTPPKIHDGTQNLKFLKGLCVDSSDVPIPSAIVQAFRTSDDAFAGYEVPARADGSYDLATNFPGVAHYVVAYDAGAPDRAGTTVNTLVPANIDGT